MSETSKTASSNQPLVKEGKRRLLSGKVRVAIVVSLAHYQRPLEIISTIREEFGLEITKQQIQCYYPYRANGRHLSKELRDLFDVERRRYQRSLQDVGIANKRYRLEMLQKAFEQADDRQNPQMVMKILEQAAKDVGGIYDHRPLPESSYMGEPDDAQKGIAFLADLLGILVEEMPPPAPPSR